MQQLLVYLRARVALRLRVLRLLPAAGGRLLAGTTVLQLFGGLAPVAFIVSTSIVVGRVPAAVDAGLGSPEWDALRNALLVAGGLFVLQQLAWPLGWAAGEVVTWRVDDLVRERVAAASLEPVGVAALEDEQTVDELSEIADPHRGLGFSPGAACAGVVALIPRYVQWLVASVFLGVVYAWWAGAAVALGSLAVRVGIRSGVGRLGAFEQRFAGERRRRDYFRTLLSSGAAAKEARVYGRPRRRAARLAGAAPDRLPAVPALDPALARARGPRHDRGGTCCRGRGADAGRARLRAAGDRARERPRHVLLGLGLVDRARPARVRRARAV